MSVESWSERFLEILGVREELNASGFPFSGDLRYSLHWHRINGWIASPFAAGRW